MNPKQIEELINLARKTFTREITFSEFAARLRFELQKLEKQKHETPEA
jgi:hypothetical protein